VTPHGIMPCDFVEEPVWCDNPNRGHPTVKRIFIALALLGAARPVLACGVCTASIVDSFAPPVQWWIILAFTWFLAHGVIRTFRPIGISSSMAIRGSSPRRRKESPSWDRRKSTSRFQTS